MTEKNGKHTKPSPADGSPHAARRFVWAVGIIGLCCYLASGFYFVQPDERAVVRRFGRIVEKQVQPGIHYSWPAPFGRVDKPKTTEIKRVEVGLSPEIRAAIAAGDIVARGSSPETDVFTGDVNIVKSTMVATYQITETDKYVTRTSRPDEMVRLAVLSVMIETLGGCTIDEALAEGKAKIQNITEEKVQRMLDLYECGITIVDVNIESIEPPFAINDAFRDVASAKKDQEKKIDEAEAFANSILPKAHASAFELIEKAKSYAETRIKTAIGETDRFLAIQRQYIRNPEVSQTRLLLTTLSNIVRKSKTYVFTPNTDEQPLRMTIQVGGGQ